MNQGWIGTWNELSNVLRTFHCDVNPDGKFCVGGSIVSYLGLGQEFVVGANAVYYVNGEPHNLVDALSSTSYGMKCSVIS